MALLMPLPLAENLLLQALTITLRGQESERAEEREGIETSKTRVKRKQERTLKVATTHKNLKRPHKTTQQQTKTIVRTNAPARHVRLCLHLNNIR